MTDARVVRLVAYLVESGAVTAAVALADLALFHGFPTTNYHMPACFVLSKAYTISFYAVSTICVYLRIMPCSKDSTN
jgi:hypothetical protein